MKITRTNPLNGLTRTREIDCTPEQLAAWEGGMVIQKAMPNLSAEDREFIISGVTPEDWETAFGPEE